MPHPLSIEKYPKDTSKNSFVVFILSASISAWVNVTIYRLSYVHVSFSLGTSRCSTYFLTALEIPLSVLEILVKKRIMYIRRRDSFMVYVTTEEIAVFILQGYMP